MALLRVHVRVTEGGKGAESHRGTTERGEREHNLNKLKNKQLFFLMKHLHTDFHPLFLAELLLKAITRCVFVNGLKRISRSGESKSERT